MLLVASATWTFSKGVNTMSLARIFFDVLSVTVVNNRFEYYKDALLFGLMLGWGLEVQSFDLQREQSTANKKASPSEPDVAHGSGWCTRAHRGG